MTKSNLIIALLAGIAIVVGWLLSSGDRQSEFESQLLFPDLQASIDMVDAISVETASGVLLQARKQDGQWVADNKAGFPLEKDKVVRLLNSLVTAQLDSAKTAKAENFARLGLTDIAEQDSAARLVSISSADSKWQVYLGDSASSGSGIYLRKPEQMQTWLSRTDVDLPADEFAWFNKQMLALDKEQVQGVSRKDHWQIALQQAEQEDAGDSWVLQQQPQDRALQYDSILANSIDDILNLRFQSLHQQRPLQTDDLSLVSEVLINTRSDDEISLHLYEEEGQHLVLVNTPDAESVQNQWVFEVSSFYADRLKRELDYFLEPPEEPDTSEAESTP